MSANLPQILSTEIARLLLPLKELNSPAQMRQFLQDLGYQFTGTLGPLDLNLVVTDVESLITKVTELIEAASEEDKILKAGELLTQILQTIETFKGQIPQVKIALSSASNLVPTQLANFQTTFLVRSLDHLIYTYIQDFVPPVSGVLYLLKILDEATDGESNLSYKKIHWSKFGTIFSRPVDLFNTGYDWDTDFKHAEFLTRFEFLLTALHIPGGIYPQSTLIQTNLGRSAVQNPLEIRMPIYQKGVWGTDWQEIDLNLSPIPTDGSKLSGLFLYPYFTKDLVVNNSLSENWELELIGKTEIGGGLGMELRPNAPISIKTSLFSASALDSLDLGLKLIARNKSDAEHIVFGKINSTYLSYSSVAATVLVQKNSSTNDAGIELQMGTLRFVLSMGEGDGFLQTILPDGFNQEFEFGLGYSLQRGFYFNGGNGLNIHINSRIPIGPIELQGLSIGFRPEDSGLQLNLGSNLKLSLGPFQAIVEDIGLSMNVSFPDGGGSLGPVDFGFDFKPPKGIGLSIDASVIKGGGYVNFEPENDRYFGALELAVADKVIISAVALINTRFPDGTPGFSLMLIVSVQFNPGIALGMGFFLNGLGGMIGINRTINTDALRASVKTNAIDNLLFPEDIVANIDSIITGVREIFPAKRGQFIIGLMAKITWGTPTLLSIEFGLAVEFPNPVRIAILGVLKAILPTEDEAILFLKVSFVGIIDFEEEYLSFDASLYGSKLLTFTLEGDMAIRLFWGGEKEFLLSLGGFHPTYTPPAYLKLSRMTRLTLNILNGNPRLILTTYFALTSNTVQFGASVDFYFKVSKFKVVGFLGFDVLFQFSPFRFVAGIEARLSVKCGNKTLMSIGLQFDLQGPTPWVAKGVASFRALLIKVDINFSKTWGDRREDALPAIVVLPTLLEAFNQSRNWLSNLPTNRFLLASIKELELEEQELLVHSVGILSINQNVMPLNMLISKFGNHLPLDIKKAAISKIFINDVEQTTTKVTESFAPAEFKTMSDNDKLKAPSYKQEDSGIKLSSTETLSLNYGIARPVAYEIRASDFSKEPDIPYESYQAKQLAKQKDALEIFQKMARRGAIGRSKLSKELEQQNFQLADAVQIETEDYTIASTLTLQKHALASSKISTKAEADDLLKTILAQQPELAGTLQVVAAYQLEPVL